MNSQTCPYPVIPLTLTSPIPECFAFFIARSIANLPMAGPFFSKREHQILFHVIQIYRRGLWITLWLIAYQECCCRPRELWICSPWLWLVRYPVRQILPYFPNISRTTLDVKGSLYDMSTYSLAGCFSFMYLFLRKCLFQTTRYNAIRMWINIPILLSPWLYIPLVSAHVRASANALACSVFVPIASRQRTIKLWTSFSGTIILPAVAIFDHISGSSWKNTFMTFNWKLYETFCAFMHDNFYDQTNLQQKIKNCNQRASIPRETRSKLETRDNNLDFKREITKVLEMIK